MLHESLQIQKHLEAQDLAIEKILAMVESARPGGTVDPPAPPAGR